MMADSPKAQVAQLINIANGGPQVMRSRHWYTLGFPLRKREVFKHGLDEQLDAVRQLGNSSDREAVAFLEMLNQSEHHTNSSNPHDSRDETYEDYFHPHAKGELGEVLRYSAVDIYDPDIGQIEKSNTKHPRFKEAQSTVEEALAKLAR